MRRASLIGPLVLIVIGTLFLLNNMWPELSVINFVANWWPVALIGWGLLRVVEHD